MKDTSLTAAAQAFASDKDTEALLEAVKKYFDIETIAEQVIPYLLGESATDGFYLIQSLEQCSDYTPTYQKLFHEYGEGLFPALNFGGDGLGVEFWLMLETGQVITLHHDATFFERAGEIRADSAAEFARKFESVGSLFSLTQLLHLQALTRDLDEGDDDFGKGLMKAASAALGISLRETADLFSDTRFEFVFSQVGDLYDFEEELEEFLAEEEGK